MEYTLQALQRISARRKGHRLFINCSILILAILQPTYRQTPTGGVITPIASVRTTIMPRWSSLNPSDFTVGSSTGTRIKIAAPGSMKVPTTSRRTTNRRRNSHGNCTAGAKAAKTLVGISSIAKIYDNAAAVDITR